MINCRRNLMVVTLVPLLCLQESLLPRGHVEGAQFQMTLSVHWSWLSGLWVCSILLPDCIGLLSTLSLIPMLPATFLFALLSFQYLQPKLPQYRYYHGVTCISAEVSGFERGWFKCSTKNPGLSWLTPCCNSATEEGLKSLEGHHST